ncbi:hypothetical protein [Streptomyces flavofungini]|uniref:Tat pathway signal sequence domain protein n=1 Tax=Streptomyces flavofungini TaxID=68200 RepID=A0ABS0WYZ0_9ACTN|nr:hypothetical protein [Streptomyces flavofungini]MBJ3806152.1 hypothetical protein [Streptomyces flavofungini]GHC47051.1 hypothetical protein GCM10010349_10150 [Streptomyces flavofungini]
MSNRRRTSALRTAAVATLVGGALLLPATGAFADSPSPAPAPHSASARLTGDAATPEGGVRAGADGVRDAGDPAFLFAGGAMAAAGAAGLGFAMMRRGRTDA